MLRSPLQSVLKSILTSLTEWVLSTGLWNDSGIWLDEQTWNDGV